MAENINFGMYLQPGENEMAMERFKELQLSDSASKEEIIVESMTIAEDSFYNEFKDLNQVLEELESKKFRLKQYVEMTSLEVNALEGKHAEMENTIKEGHERTTSLKQLLQEQKMKNMTLIDDHDATMLMWCSKAKKLPNLYDSESLKNAVFNLKENTQTLKKQIEIKEKKVLQIQQEKERLLNFQDPDFENLKYVLDIHTKNMDAVQEQLKLTEKTLDDNVHKLQAANDVK